MSSAVGRSPDTLNREIAALRQREKDLRDALSRASKQHEEDKARIQRLEARSSLDTNLNRIAALEQRLRVANDEKQVLTVQLEEAAETEQALRNELAVLQQISEWDDFPERRAAAVTTVRAREIEHRFEALKSQYDVSQRRVDELTEELAKLTDDIREGDDALLAAHGEIERLGQEVAELRHAAEENDALRNQLGDAEAELQELRSEVEIARPRLEELEQEAANHRTSWKTSRVLAEEWEAKAQLAASERENLDRENRRLRIDHDNAKKEIEAYTLEIATLRKREAQWEDEHALLADAKQEIKDLKTQLSLAQHRLESTDALCRTLDEQRTTDQKSIEDYRTRLNQSESTATELRETLNSLQREFTSLERQAGRQALELENTSVSASAENGSLRLRVQSLEAELQLVRAKLSAMRHEASHSAARVSRSVTDAIIGSSEKLTGFDWTSPHGAAEAVNDVGRDDPAPTMAHYGRFESRPGLRRLHRRDFGGGDTSASDVYFLSPQTPSGRN